jgi:hypothetical protein
MQQAQARSTGTPSMFPLRFPGGALRLFSLLCLLCLILPTPFQARAETPRSFVLNAPVLETDSGDVIIRLGVSVDSLEGLRDMLKDGAIMELAIKARLARTRTFLPNVTLSEVELASPLRHNPLTREYSLTMPGAGQAIVDKNLPRLLAATWQKIAFSMGSVSLFQEADAGSEYRITLTLSLRHTEVPPWLAKAFIFWSWDVVDPETLTITFTF